VAIYGDVRVNEVDGPLGCGHRRLDRLTARLSRGREIRDVRGLEVGNGSHRFIDASGDGSTDTRRMVTAMAAGTRLEASSSLLPDNQRRDPRFKRSGDRLPPAVHAQLEALEQRLG